MASEETKEDLGYRLTITVRGPNFSGSIEIKSGDPNEFEPKQVEICGFAYHRYPGEDDNCFVDVRADYVVERVVERVQPEPKSDPPSISEEEERDLLAAPAEARVGRKP